MLPYHNARPRVRPMTQLRCVTARRTRPFVAVALAHGACASAPEVELALDEARASTTAAARDTALEGPLRALDVERLQLALTPPDLRGRPDQPGYWFARAVAYAPTVRAALTEWRAARAAISSAGAPEPALLEVDDHSIADPFWLELAESVAGRLDGVRQ